MMVTIDRAGRIVVPKSIRDQLDLSPERPLALSVEGDSIRISRAPAPVRTLEFTDDGRPFFPAGDEPPLGDLDVQQVRDGLQR